MADAALDARAVADERPAPAWPRRLLSIPGLVLVAAVAWSAAPALLGLALVADLVRRARLAWTRALLLVLAYLGAEVLGLGAAGGLWLVGRAGDLRAHFRLQTWWAGSLFRIACRLYGLELEVTGDAALRPAPYVLLLRHASVADTLIPAALVAERFGVRFRYVLKRELLWDPCLDVVGGRLPNVFVRRDGGEGGAETARVRALASGLASDEGALIFPEGTRFSEGRRTRALARLEGTPQHAAASTLRHVLPPRPGGTFALLDGAPEADVVVCAHQGFDVVRTLADFFDGAFIGQRVRVHFWRVPRAQVPAAPEARLAWLMATWAEVDAWVDAQARA